MFALRGVNRIMDLIRTIVLARLLSPDDFGVMGIALLVLSTLDTFSQTGFMAALIQRKGNIREYLDAAWSFSILRGTLIFILLFITAPWIAGFFESPASQPVIRAIAISILLKGMINIGVVYFQKELEFHREFVYQLSGTVANLAVAIPAAILVRNVWALVIGLLAGSGIRLVASYLVHPFRPRFSLGWGKAKDLFDFGRYIFARSILLFILTQGDDAFVGKILGTAALGYYQLAYRLSNLSATEITHVVSQVTFPAYAKIQDQTLKLTKALSRTLRITSLIAMPVAAGLAAIAPELVEVIFGEKWLPMVPSMQVLCLFGVMRSITASFGPVFQAVARLDIPLKINVFQLIVLGLLIYPLSDRWGILGTALSVTIMLGASIYLFSRGIANLLGIRTLELGNKMLTPAVASMGMFLIIWMIKPYLTINPDFLMFVFFIFGGVVSYLCLLFMLYFARGNHPSSLMNEFEKIKELV